MKRLSTILFSLFATSVCVSAQTQQTCTIEGMFKGLKSDTLVVSFLNEKGYERQDTLVLKNGKTGFSVEVDALKEAEISTTQRADRTERIYLLPGTQLVIDCEGALNNCTFSGSPIYQDINEAKHCTDKANQLRTEVGNKMSAMIANGATNEEAMTRYKDESEAANKNFGKALVDYIESHLDNDGVVIVLSPYSPYYDFGQYIDRVSERVKQGPFGPMFAQYVKNYQEEKRKKEQRELFASGTMEAPDFTLPSIDGGTLTLSSLRGKYVMLDFWGTWCYWCMKGMPKIKEYYEKYKGKLEVLGIDTNDKDEKWKQTVKEKEMNWKHVKDDGSIDMRKLYVIKGYPTYVLINPEGKMIGYACGESQEFFDTIDKEFSR